MIEISLSDVEKIAGYGRKQGKEWVFQCPFCMDSHKDNLKFNEQKGILYCFANDEHSKKILSDIAKEKNKYKKNDYNVMQQIPQWKIDQQQYIKYMSSCNDMLLGKWSLVFKDLFETDVMVHIGKEKQMLDYLYEQRGIKLETVKNTGLGFDFEANKWVLPIFDCNFLNTIVGFEYRAKDFSKKKIWREIDTPKCLSLVYGGSLDDNTLYICEGFFDAYVLIQWLLETNQKNFAVATPSNGVNCIHTAMKQIKFNFYKKIKLMLDNDEAGDKATEEVLKDYPFVIDARKFLKDSNCKDITEYYKKFLLKKNLI